MLAKLKTFTLVGIDAAPVEAEVDVAAGLPKTVLVGLPELSVRESVHRIERALVNLGYQRHPGRTVINLAPADLKKNAGGFDLPIAVGMLVDNSIVVLENIYSFYQRGHAPREAAEKAASEVWGAVFASTMTTLAVFMPVVFLAGEVGQLFVDIALAISAAVGLSLLVSVLVIPTAAARVIRTSDSFDA